MEKSRQSILLKQFKTVSQRLNGLLDGAPPGPGSREMAHALAQQLRRLYFALRMRMGSRRLRRIMAGAAFLVGVAGPAQAQVTPNFPTSVTSPFGIVSQATMFAIPMSVDIDGDGDLDILVNEDYGNFRFYENIGTPTMPMLDSAVTSPFGLVSDSLNGSVPTPCYGDLDGDGDYDILTGENYDGHFYYFENIGTATAPNFASPVRDTFGLTPTPYIAFPELADLDDDGDLDMFVGQYYGIVTYYENIGDSVTPLFAAPQTNPFGLQPGYVAVWGRFGDMDADGDLDMIYGEINGNYQYWENTGTPSAPNFTGPQTNPWGLTGNTYYNFHTLADWDGDGDLDILENEYGGIYEYHENQPLVGNTPSFTSSELSISPNPSQGMIRISYASEEIFGAVDLRILSIEGKLIHQWREEPVGGSLLSRWDGSQLPSGMYFLEMEVDGQMVRQRFSRM